MGSSDEYGNRINADGVPFAAIKRLSQELNETRATLDARDECIDEPEADGEHSALWNGKAYLRERLATVEALLGLACEHTEKWW